MSETDLLMCKDGFTCDYLGQPVFVNAGDVIRAGHPVLRGREQFFVPLIVKFDHAPPAAPARAEPARTEHAPVSPVKPAASSARTR